MLKVERLFFFPKTWDVATAFHSLTIKTAMKLTIQSNITANWLDVSSLSV